LFRSDFFASSEDIELGSFQYSPADDWLPSVIPAAPVQRNIPTAFWIVSMSVGPLIYRLLDNT
jgi:hypothetical protein